VQKGNDPPDTLLVVGGKPECLNRHFRFGAANIRMPYRRFKWES
jgi:hypothetical protein